MGNANYRLTELGATGDPGDWVALFISETEEREGWGKGAHSRIRKAVEIYLFMRRL